MASSSHRRLTLTAPSRLHFGLYSLGHGKRRFGGVGVMINPPALQLELLPSEQFEVCGNTANRIHAFAEKWRTFYQEELPHCRLEVVTSPPSHAGLGSGTQLALAVGTALSAWAGRPIDEPQVLARALNRGNRSAVGTYGFAQGGMIAERGWSDEDFFPPLDARLDFPAAWRFVLLQPPSDHSIFGQAEEACLAALPAPSPETTLQLVHLARESLLPAAAALDFDRFSRAIYQYNALSGMLYASVQGGPYHGPVVTSLVDTCRKLGVEGVGQSSWGPTVFTLLPDAVAARQFANQVRSSCVGQNLQITIAAACNQGAVVNESA